MRCCGCGPYSGGLAGEDSADMSLPVESSRSCLSFAAMREWKRELFDSYVHRTGYAETGKKARKTQELWTMQSTPWLLPQLRRQICTATRAGLLKTLGDPFYPLKYPRK